MTKIQSMPVKNVFVEDVAITDNYHQGRSAALKVHGVGVIITAKNDDELATVCRGVMSQSFGLDYSLVRTTATFGVVVP